MRPSPEQLTAANTRASMAAHAERLTVAADVDSDDLHTYAHVSFDLDTVREYRQAQRTRRQESEDEWTQ